MVTEMIKASAFAEQAKSSAYDGIPYSELDCQAFVEKVLGDCGCKKSNGARYNWTGSNKMWRVALNWKGTLAQARAQWGDIPVGAWVFTVKYDGGEKERGYNDNEGNAKHVGIYIGDGRVRHSSTGGVQYAKIDEARWTHCGLCKYLDYGDAPVDDKISSVIALLEEALKILKG